MPPSLLIGAAYDALLCVFHILQKLHLECKQYTELDWNQSCRLILAQPLIGSIIRKLHYISSVLSVWEVLCCLYWHNLDGCRSKLVNVVSGVRQSSVLGPILFLLYTSELFYILENKLIGYADDSIFLSVAPSPASVTRLSVVNRSTTDIISVVPSAARSRLSE